MTRLRVTFAHPGAEPYLTIKSSPGTFPPLGQLAVLGGESVIERGEFPGDSTLILSGPLPAEARIGDWVRVYQPGDAENDPTYLGEIVGEPHGAGKGELRLRAITESVARCAWDGTVQAQFQPYLTYALEHCLLPPGVTVGEIPARAATLKADMPFELLGDTMTAAMPVIDGGTWGVDRQGRVSVRAPLLDVTHNFRPGDADTPPGDGAGYANSVRFSYRTPTDQEAWFEAGIPDEVAVRGEVWETTQVPASVGESTENPLEGQSADVTLWYQIALGTHYPARVRADGAAWTIAGPVTVNLPVFDPAWTGHLAGPESEAAARGARRGGWRARPQTVEESTIAVGVEVPGRPADFSAHRVRMALRGRAPGQTVQFRLIEQRGAARASTDWTDVLPVAVSGDGELFEHDFFRGLYSLIAVEYRYSPQTFVPGVTALELGTGGLLADGSGGWVANPATRGDVWHAVQAFGVLRWRLTESYQPLQGVGGWISDLLPVPTVTLGALPEESGLYNARIDLPYPVTLPPGSRVLSAGTGVEYLGTLRTDGTRGALGSYGPPENGLQVHTHSAEEPPQTIRALLLGPRVTWNPYTSTPSRPAEVGYMRLELPGTAALTAYALGLLRYRTQPARVWTGRYRTMRRVREEGVAVFRTARGDVALDVQRVIYDWTAWTVRVEAGTPTARSDAQAAARALEGQRRELRGVVSATGGTP